MRPGHAAIFSVTQSSLDSVHVWEEGFSGVPNLSLSQQPLLVVTVSMHQNLGQHYAKVLCVGEKSSSESSIWPWSYSLCKSWPCANFASGWSWRHQVRLEDGCPWRHKHTSNVLPHPCPGFLLHLSHIWLSSTLKESKIHQWWLSVREPDVHSSWWCERLSLL